MEVWVGSIAIAQVVPWKPSSSSVLDCCCELRFGSGVRLRLSGGTYQSAHVGVGIIVKD